MDENPLPDAILREFAGARLNYLELVHHRHRLDHAQVGAWSQRPYATITWMRRGRVRTYFADGTPPMSREADSIVFHAPNVRKRSEFASGKVTEFVAALVTMETTSGLDLLAFVEIPARFPPAASTRLRQLLSRLMKLNHRPKSSRQLTEVLEYRAISLEILRLFLASARLKSESIASPHAQRLIPVLQKLCKQFRDEVNVPELARAASLSRAQFYRQFHQLTGVAPMEYVKNLRMNEAEQLLLHQNLSVKEVGERVGWPDPFHFSRMFRKFFGTPPARYKAQHLNALNY